MSGPPCKGRTDLFFPEKGRTDLAAKAKAICRTQCPLGTRIDCYLGALRRCEAHGIWGGYSADELLRLRRRDGRFAGTPSTLLLPPRSSSDILEVLK